VKTLTVVFEVPGTTVTSVAVESEETERRVELPLVGGQAETTLPAGSYVLRWRAEGGQPDTEYTIEITSPPEAVWAPDPRERTTPKGRAAGQEPFRIDL
jgi:hypothetical protein